MNFKRFNGSTWETVQHKIYGSGTEQLASFPAQIQASGEPLTEYTISGNTVQNGTPTPEAPVDVVGCGVRTENLCPMIFSHTGVGDDNGAISTYDTRLWSDKIPVSALQNYYVVIDGTASNDEELCFNRIIQYDANGVFISRIKVVNLTSTSFTTSANCRYVVLDIRTRTLAVNISAYDINMLMLNSGSTALPYEPYGYKLPITCGGEMNNIYLGQVETTRKIKKLVLTGVEAITIDISYNRFYFTVQDMRSEGARLTKLFCTHYQNISDGRPIANVPNNSIYTGGGIDIQKVFIKTTDYTTVSDFKSYLAAQYAAGTPVTIWYVLANPETGIVNEPIHKIGGYADTITMAQAGVTIPTSDGDNTISFGTTVQPSAMSATFKGWHAVQGAKVYDGNDWS